MTKKLLKKIAKWIAALVMSILTFVASVMIIVKTPIGNDYNNFHQLLVFIGISVTILLFWFTLFKIVKMQFSFSFGTTVVLILVSIALFASPFKVAWGDVGKYVSGDYVLARRRLIPSLSKLREGDVVVFVKQSDRPYLIGEIVSHTEPGYYSIKIQKKELKIEDKNIWYVVWMKVYHK